MSPARRAPRRRGALIPLAAIAGLLLALGTLACAGDGTPATARRPSRDLINPHLSPGLAQWLVGPIVHIATPAEVDQYLALTDDAAAQAFVDAFWRAHDRTLPLEGDDPLHKPTVHGVFDARAAEADRRFSEAGYLGRRTDRGTIWVLYGAPNRIDHDLNPGGEPIERWHYESSAADGLDGKAPWPVFSFIKSGDLTVFYHAPVKPAISTSPGFR